MKKNLLFVTLVVILACGRSSDKPLSLITGYIDVGEAQLYYEELGKGEPLILIHGGFLDRRMWDDQFSVFAKKYRVIRYDVRNHGLSKGVADTFSHHQDLNELMKGLGIEKACIMGLSMGGYVAIDFTLAYPEQVTALIPVSPGITGYDFNTETMKPYLDKMREAAQKEDLAMYIEYFQKAWTDGPQREPSQVDSVVRNKIRDMAVNTVSQWNPQSREVRLDPPAIHRLKEIKVPTLTILGELDMPEIKEIVEMIGTEVPGARKAVIPEAAHVVNMEKPEAFNKIVLDFLNKLD